ncbi:MFS transporter [Clostridium sp. AL.422]|uniref:MFS transporter n=1 Tax=Clostridium TaxID=1485 RepID=UPI00293DAAA6|nr:MULTISPECIES: MFS transporter [unclassified Clostridium]MDV4149468.1 MFS transporter [Clostridium sp. AL.422]
MPEKQKNKGKYFIVFICFLIGAIPYCISQNLQPQMQIPVSHSGIISDVGFTMIYFTGTIPVLFNGLTAKIYDKYKIKYIYVAGLILSAIGFGSFGLAKNNIMFNISAIITQLGAVLVVGLSLPVIIGRWFPYSGRGTALGIALSGGSVGNVFLQPIVVNLLSRYGWQKTYIILGIVIAVIGVPIALLFIRDPKKDEIEVDHIDSENNTHKVNFQGLSNEELLKNKYFVIFCIASLLICFAGVALATQSIPYLTIKGFTDTKIGLAGSVYGITCLIGNVGGGKLFDNLGTFKAMIISCIFVTIGLVIMIFMPNGSFIGFAIPFFAGLAIFTLTSAPAFTPVDVFGTKDSTKKFALVGIFYAIGSAFSPLLFTILSNNMNVSVAAGIFLIIGLLGYLLIGYSIIQYKKSIYE